MVEKDKIKRQKVTVMSPVSPLGNRTHQYQNLQSTIEK